MTLSSETAPFDIFQWLSPTARAEFENISKSRSHLPGTLIYQQGDAGHEMYRLVSGAVRLSVMTAGGRELVYLLFEPGDCFGVSTLIDDGPLPQTAEAGDDCVVQVLDRSGFEQMRRSHRSFDDALLRLVTRHMRLLSGYFADANLRDLTARVAGRLVAAGRSFGREAGGAIEIKINLPQAEIALMVGGSRQTVNKILQSFQQEGIIAIKGNKIIINSIKDLEIISMS